MKILQKLTYVIILVILGFISCDEKYDYSYKEPEMIYNQINDTFFAGQKDSCEYYDYEPDMEFYLGKEFGDEYDVVIDSVDLDSNGIFDFAVLRRDGWLDSPFNQYDCDFYLRNLLYYNTVCVIDYYNADKFNYGDTLFDKLEWHGNTDFLLLADDSHDDHGNIVINGYWSWDEEKYFIFRQTYPDTVLGWIRIEYISETASMQIKDCGIKRIHNN